MAERARQRPALDLGARLQRSVGNRAVGRLVEGGTWPFVQRVDPDGRLTTPQDLFDTLPRAVQRRLARLPGHIRAHLERLPWTTQTALWRLDEIDQLDVIDALELLSNHRAMVPVSPPQRAPQHDSPEAGALAVVGTATKTDAEAQLPPGLVDLLRGLDPTAVPFVQILASSLKVSLPLNLTRLSGVGTPPSGLLALEGPPGVMSASPELLGPPPKLLGGGDGLTTLTITARQPILDTSEDEPELNVPHSLVAAYRADLVQSRAYLSEAEGQALAEHWNVRAELFKQLNPSEKDVIPQPTLNEGGGSNGKGTLLHIGENHYIVISEVTSGPFDYIERISGRKFTVLHRTVSNGDCLIDGLHRLITPTQVSAEEVFEARSWLSKNLDEQALTMVLTTMLNDMLVGEFPHGAGPKTLAMLREDAIWGAFKVAEAEKLRKDALKKEEAEKRKRAEAEKEKAKASLDKPKDEGEKPKDEAGVGGTKAPPKARVPMTPEQLDELRAFRGSKDNESIIALNEYIAEQRAKLLTSGKSDGLPHVFNKVFLPLKDGLSEVLEDAAKYQDPLLAAREIAKIADDLHKEWEELHRKHLIADMPPTKGPPDENSLAFGSNGRALKLALKQCYEALVVYLLAPKEERQTRAQQSTEALRLVQAQFVQLADSAVDPDAERFITNRKNVNTTAVKENTDRIANAKTYKLLKTQELTGVVLPSFFRALGEGLTAPLVGTPKKRSEKSSGKSPQTSPETSSETSVDTSAPKQSSTTGARQKLSREEMITLAKQYPGEFEKRVNAMLDALKLAAKQRAESRKTSSIDPTLKAIEYIQSILARNTPQVWKGTIESIETAESDRDARSAYGDLARVFRKDLETIKLIFNHATKGFRSNVLPPEASPAMTPKAESSDFSAQGFPIIGDPRLVYYNSTNARNVTYATKDDARLACMGFLGLDPTTAKPHGRYAITQDKVRPPDLDDTQIWIKAAPDPIRGGDGSPDQGWVEEYETPNGPMLLIYHENDCTVKLKIGSAKQTRGARQAEDIRSRVPHFHVATLPPNAIDLEYWEKAGTEERPPQFGSVKSGATTGVAKEYQQHDTEHHIYHL